MTTHEHLVLSDIHCLHAFEYADEAARTGAVGLTSADIGKMCRQLDDDSFWLLLDTGPSWHDLSSYVETDPVFVASDAYSITTTDRSNWDTAYGWGDHGLVGYLTVESDPIYSGDPAATISSQDITNWNTAFGWGGPATNYLLDNADDETTGALTMARAIISDGGVKVNRVGDGAYLALYKDDVIVGQIRAENGYVRFCASSNGDDYLRLPSVADVAMELMPDASGNIECFGTVDVANGDDGKELKIWRRAAEGNDYLRFYITAGETAMVHSNTSITFQAQNPFTINSVTDSIILKVGDNAGVERVSFQDSDNAEIGYINSDGIQVLAGALGIGITEAETAPSYPLDVWGDAEYTARFADTSAYGLGTGATIVLEGHFTGGNNTAPGAGIGAAKYVAGGGELGFDCVLYSHINGIKSTLDEVARFSAEDSLATLCGVTLTADASNNVYIHAGPLPASFDTAASNIVLGAGSGPNITSGDGNLIIGTGSGLGITDGFGNIIIGSTVGNDTGGTSTDIDYNNILIGMTCETINGASSNSLNIGNLIWGNLSTDKVRIGGGQSAALESGAALEVKSTTGGLLVPRMTTTQRGNIGSPVNGLIIYNTTTNAFNYRQANQWVAL